MDTLGLVIENIENFHKRQIWRGEENDKTAKGHENVKCPVSETLITKVIDRKQMDV